MASTSALIAACGGVGDSGPSAVSSLTTGRVELGIGVVEGEPEYQFSSLTNVETLPDGAVLTADVRTRELAVYDAAGRHRWTTGGHGDAPGEFSFLTWAGHDGSNAMAWDFAARQLLQFQLADGAFLQSVRFSGLGARSWVWGRFSDGSVLGMTEDLSPPDSPGGLLPNDGRFVRAGPEGDHEVVLEFDGAPWADVDGVLQQAPLTVGAIGDVRGDTMWIMLPAGGGYRVIAPEGSANLVVGDSTTRVLTDELRDAYRVAQLATVSTAQRARFVRRLETIDLLETFPAYDDMVVGIDRRVWLRRFEVAAGEMTSWDVFDPGGTLVARAAVPSRFNLTEAGSQYVLGIWKDEFEVNYVRRYTLVESDIAEP